MRAVGFTLALFACGAGGPRGLEIGVRQGDAFHALHDGDPLALLFNTNGGIDLVTIALATDGADRRAPAVTATVTMDGRVLGGYLRTREPWDMEPVGGRDVLWDVNLGISERPCCHVCRDAVVEATLTDAGGQEFSGRARVVLGRGAACPDASVCCESAQECVLPATAQVCR